jgi:hydroxymethylbilane synthase
VISIRIGTRGSLLALAQANWVRQRIEDRCADLSVEIVVIKTTGDRIVDAPPQTLRGKGVFTKEIEDALLSGDIDLAVHSMKDLPPELPAGLVIAAVPKREDPRDVLVSRGALRFDDLPGGAKIGTGSLRRKAQVLHSRPDLSVTPIRGNIDTRLRKMDQGEVDAVILAAAGLTRIGRQDRIVEHLSEKICLSAAAQGALGLECREEDPLRKQIMSLQDEAAFSEIAAERSFLNRLEAGCHVPVGARATFIAGTLHLMGVIAHPDGTALFRDEASGAATKAVELGRSLAERLLDQGADRILALTLPTPAGRGEL